MLRHLIPLCLLLTACGTTQDHRARQYAREFNALDASTRQRALSGWVRIGDPRVAVYIALGKPREAPDIAMPPEPKDGTELWTFLGNLEESEMLSVRFRSTYDAVLMRVENGETLEVYFRDGAVETIQHLKVKPETAQIWE
ncbi:MAG: hypothetical protein HRU10_10380 [Opitutales bacterium]|nr:hypothetical protein [Opitutales bacterium]